MNELQELVERQRKEHQREEITRIKMENEMEAAEKDMKRRLARKEIQRKSIKKLKENNWTSSKIKGFRMPKIDIPGSDYLLKKRMVVKLRRKD